MKRPFPSRWLRGSWKTHLDSGGYFNGPHVPEWRTVRMNGRKWVEACVPSSAPRRTDEATQGGIWTALTPAEISPTRDPAWVLIDFADSFLRYRLREVGARKESWDGLPEQLRQRVKAAVQSSNVILTLLADVVDYGGGEPLSGVNRTRTNNWRSADSSAANQLLAKITASVTADQQNPGGYQQGQTRREGREIALVLLPLLEEETDRILSEAAAMDEAAIEATVWEDPVWIRTVVQRLRDWCMDRGLDVRDSLSIPLAKRLLPARPAKWTAAEILSRTFGPSVSMDFLLGRGGKERIRTRRRAERMRSG